MFNNNTIQRFNDTETPFYYYDMDVLRNTLDACRDASSKYGFHVHYAMKANFNPKVVKTIQLYGFGADCVSGNEVKSAVEHGFDKGKVVFAGVGKSDKEINLALDADIFCFNVESVQELEIINELAAAKGKIAGIAIRINPNVDAHTHHFITTGLDENKFGINTWQLNDVAEMLRKCANLKFLGIHFHIGSQITDMEVYRNLCTRINEMQDWFEDHGFAIKILNTGGGLGVDYYNPDTNSIADFEAYFKVFSKFLRVKPGQEVHFELGRAMVAQSASLISRVLYVKNGQKKNFLILDAGMTELMRPMLYQAYHSIQNLSQESRTKNQEKSEADNSLSFGEGRGEAIKYDVVGPICESTDCFRKDVDLPQSYRGDLIAIRTAGAYGEVMASNYNLRDHVQSVYSE
ncbi:MULTISPECIES: diaminopimelate decarboxylase [unclassified Mucilaginibacter]|uniref:diaminopimelate decarboxylase n=1 Tax=unclassified Mucilaginibacter TaxID=2617802 RepID=UPI002AC9ACA1|nr:MULTISPECIES: diaminopimelate decarboxylase [unclassified Mucilaginibacter]MEB0262270.1 diaminopimelate decarboxylase [Mucilaginibacter sp. 10I4]MEB0277106.1 diaminopimelate decarboxylase [Mucilaginibacter sp. 10B2]MEB0301828.1 diaminopimelate decarboxylase [Mucilaginibacter sp. 5C4]WPX25206.1 diaminopimelate decarboxylase [Mucilaginibacter sp. 5C4]